MYKTHKQNASLLPQNHANTTLKKQTCKALLGQMRCIPSTAQRRHSSPHRYVPSNDTSSQAPPHLSLALSIRRHKRSNPQLATAKSIKKAVAVIKKANATHPLQTILQCPKQPCQRRCLLHTNQPQSGACFCLTRDRCQAEQTNASSASLHGPPQTMKLNLQKQ